MLQNVSRRSTSARPPEAGTVRAFVRVMRTSGRRNGASGSFYFLAAGLLGLWVAGCAGAEAPPSSGLPPVGSPMPANPGDPTATGPGANGGDNGSEDNPAAPGWGQSDPAGADAGGGPDPSAADGGAEVDSGGTTPTDPSPDASSPGPDASEPPPTDPTPADPPTGGGDPAPPPPTADCPRRVEVIVWNGTLGGILAQAFADNLNPCAEYYVSLPAVMDAGGLKTVPRSGPSLDALHALGPQVHAMAEFHWASWHNWLVANPGQTWHDAGVEFRRRMVTAGYDLASGDTWSVNEFSSAVRKGVDDGRLNSRNAVRGLFTGPAGAPQRRGAVFLIGTSQTQVNFSVFKPQWEDLLSDSTFWNDMNSYVRWFGAEVYTNPPNVCVGSATVAERRARVNDFIMHPARLAAVGPAAAAAARRYFDKAYVPLVGASWGQPSSHGYGAENISVDQMKTYVSLQIYAMRYYADHNSYPDGRLGFGWDPDNSFGLSDADYKEKLGEVGTRIARAIRDGYKTGATASHVCSPSGAYTLCDCSVAGAAFNDAWQTFSHW
jgi:hypothetical protein